MSLIVAETLLMLWPFLFWPPPVELLEKERHVITISRELARPVLARCDFTLAPDDPVFLPAKTSTMTLYFFTARQGVKAEDVIQAFMAYEPPLRAATVIEVFVYLPEKIPPDLPPIAALGAFRHHDPNDLKNPKNKFYPVIEARS